MENPISVRNAYYGYMNKNRCASNLALVYAEATERLPAGYVAGPVLRDCYIVEYCTAGAGTVVQNGRSFHVKAGDAIVLFPGCVTTLIADRHDPWATAWVCLVGAGVGYYLNLFGVTPASPFFAFHALPRFLEMMTAFTMLWKDGGRLTEFEQNICANRFFLCVEQLTLGHAREAVPNPAIRFTRYAQEAQRFIEHNFHRSIQIRDVANYVHLDRTYFSTQFKAVTGISPAQWLTEYRIKKACEFLRNPHASVASVAISVGYEPRNFVRIFKRVKGISPSAYRKSLL